MKPLFFEGFSGSGDLGKELERQGFAVVTSDLEHQSTHQGDLLEIPLEKIYNRGEFFGMHFSPPCTTFSVASIGTHWGPNKTPKTEAGRIGLQLLNRTVQLINYFKPRFFTIENPRGMMRKMPIMDQFDRHTIWYCQYGDERAKPTDIWFNRWPKELPILSCKNGNPDCDHERAPRGSKTGTQGRKNAYERSRFPEEFVKLYARAMMYEYEETI